jgi:hypothetical protein
MGPRWREKNWLMRCRRGGWADEGVSDVAGVSGDSEAEASGPGSADSGRVATPGRWRERL